MESSSGYCSPEEGGIGYARHFIQQWSNFNHIPFAWMLDDNVQLCHELDVSTGYYTPCGFTDVMDSLERVLLLPDSTTIVVGNEQQSVAEHAVNQRGCPTDLISLRRQEIPGDAEHPISVADFCGRPDHYGVLGISRHGLGNENTRDTKEPFDINHSVYSFCLLNVRRTVTREAFYPMKRYWEDVEFNHIVDEKGLAVCMFRKFSHCKRNLQPHHPQPPLLCPTPAFEHDDIGFEELMSTYEQIPPGSTMVIPTAYLDSLLEYLSCHVLVSINAGAIVYPNDSNKVCVVDESFEVIPTVPEQKSDRIGLQTEGRPAVVLIMLLKGLGFASLALFKHVTERKVSASLRNTLEYNAYHHSCCRICNVIRYA